MTTEGITASNREFRRYDQVTKTHTYRLAENPTDEFDDDYRIPCFDIGPFLTGDANARRRFADGFGGAVRDIGFAIITGHGVPMQLYQDIEREVERFFTSFSQIDKLRFRAERFGSVSQGYFPMRETSDIHPDLVEGWVWCRRAFDIPQSKATVFHPEAFWPDPRFEPIFRELVLAHEPLFAPIAQAMLMSLGCDPHLYDDKLRQTNFGLRLNYYPPLNAEEDASGAGRLLGHEDVDLFTILPAPSGAGFAGVESQEWKMGSTVGSAGFDHHQHWRLHATHQQRSVAFHHPSGRQTSGRIAMLQAAGVFSDGSLRVGGRGAGGITRTRRTEVSADSGADFSHPQHR